MSEAIFSWHADYSTMTASKIGRQAIGGFGYFLIAWTNAVSRAKPCQAHSSGSFKTVRLNLLRDRGIICNREVENRPGEKTDIRIEARSGKSQDQAELITLIVEAKGNWHPSMKAAMRKQLVERYLNRTTTSHGLYVVGWYNCEKWDPTDSRQQRAPNYDHSEAQRRLDKLAQEFSTGGKRIRAVVIDTALRY